MISCSVHEYMFNVLERRYLRRAFPHPHPASCVATVEMGVTERDLNVAGEAGKKLMVRGTSLVVQW